VVLGTAHPAKFPVNDPEGDWDPSEAPLLEKLREKQQVRYDLDPDADEIRAFMLLNE